jgi:RimJ/RimL family protein N-acetyltransferase
MIHLLSPSQYPAARQLFGSLDFHLAAPSVLEGTAPGEIYVDDPDRPGSALLHTGYRFYLAGFEHNPAFNQGLREHFFEQVYPQALTGGQVDFSLAYAPGDWEQQIPTILKGKYPMPAARQYLELKALRQDWRKMLPPGYELRPVDAALLQHTHLAHLDDLREEMVSECPSVDEFLATKFGFCAVFEGRELAAWCLSEYNLGQRCEIGIETQPEHRKRGLATATASALIEHAGTLGITRIGWDCFTSNTPSSATALRLGFEKVYDYAIYFAFFDEAANLAVNGNLCLRAGRPAEALEWYQLAELTGKAPAWAGEMAEKARRLLPNEVK